MAKGLIVLCLIMLLVVFSIVAYGQSSLEAHAKDLELRAAIIETKRQLIVDKESNLLALAQELDAQILREKQAVVVEVLQPAAVPPASSTADTSALKNELSELGKLRQAQIARQEQLTADQAAAQKAAAQAAAKKVAALEAQQATATQAAQLAAQQSAAAELARQQTIAQKTTLPKTTSAS